MSAKIGIVIAILGLLIMGFAFVGMGSASGSSQVCDLSGIVKGHVSDYNLVKSVHSWDINLSTKNCRDKGIGDSFKQWWDGLTNSFGTAAISSAGFTDITVRIFDEEGELVDQTKFTVTTAQFEAEKDFAQQVTFRTLDKGEVYTVNTYAHWTGDEVKYSEQVKVE